MTLSIEIPPQTETRLRQQAEAAGKDVGVYVSELLVHVAAKPALDEILAPLRKQFADMGIGDEELVADITDAQTDYRAQKHKKPA
jgi:hypothetical protein